MLKGFTLVLALTLAACEAREAEKALSRTDATAIARDAAAENLSGISGDTAPSGVWEFEKVWVIEFVLDARALGGSFTAVIDKRDGKVIVAFAEQ